VIAALIPSPSLSALAHKSRQGPFEPWWRKVSFDLCQLGDK